MDNTDVNHAYILLTTLATVSKENHARYLPVFAPHCPAKVVRHLMEGGFLVGMDDTYLVALTPLGRQKAELIIRAVCSLISCDWAERLPRAIAADRANPYDPSSTLNKP